jgi:hypothetical protein
MWQKFHVLSRLTRLATEVFIDTVDIIACWTEVTGIESAIAINILCCEPVVSSMLQAC